jgi:FkbM family methyltransferase
MNSELLKRRFWDAVRPLHSPLTRAMRKRLGRNYFEHPEMQLPPPYEAIQLEVERHLHRYLHVSAEEIEQIVIVGANDGGEIWRLRSAYPKSRFLCFEPSPKWYARLTQSFRGIEFVESRELALSESAGTATFHELALDGNGSLLAPDLTQWSKVTQTTESAPESFSVNVSTLDEEAAKLERIDLLWVDVQGAEGKVLAGGTQTLSRVAAVFLEVWLTQPAYEGGALFPEINSRLQDAGFSCVGMGLDSWNFTGNALWIRNLDDKVCKPTTP